MPGISIHSPYTGRDTPVTRSRPPTIFQSTLPIQGETLLHALTQNYNHFNPLSLYRERPFNFGTVIFLREFQSTLPIQGETDALFMILSSPAIFQSTLPIQGETSKQQIRSQESKISIHSPYTGRDEARPIRPYQYLAHFNPLSLYRERRFFWIGDTCNTSFQSTLPIQGETNTDQSLRLPDLYFNPLSLYRERRFMIAGERTEDGFQSTLPIQGETNLSQKHCLWDVISIHSPYTGRDSTYTLPSFDKTFQSTLPIQGETHYLIVWLLISFISIHSPYTGRDRPFHSLFPS